MYFQVFLSHKRVVAGVEMKFTNTLVFFTRAHALSGLDAVLLFALSQGLVEALAQRNVGLVLGAVQELFDLPSASTARLLLMSVVGCWGRGGGSWCWFILGAERSREC
jgi:hypothetical protein